MPQSIATPSSSEQALDLEKAELVKLPGISEAGVDTDIKLTHAADFQ